MISFHLRIYNSFQLIYNLLIHGGMSTLTNHNNNYIIHQKPIPNDKPSMED